MGGRGGGGIVGPTESGGLLPSILTAKADRSFEATRFHNAAIR
jgi:hypothetical protein